MTLFEQATQNLNRYWGYPAFRKGQDRVVQSILDGNHTLVLFPTGGGKSLCYQVPATVLDGLTIVISPLVALMQDQVEQLHARGISATFVNSTIPGHEVEQRLINARNGMYKLLYCSPERLKTPLWQNELPNLDISLIAVDEAHCISEWGHRFRPPYREIRESMGEYGAKTRWMALTASATPEVRDDILATLEFESPTIVSKGFQRANLKYWVTATDRPMLKLQDMVKRAEGAGLIYAPTRQACENLASDFRRAGFQSAAYHAGLDADTRAGIQQNWISNETPLVVATNAFGMGIDKPDCRWVFHYQMPGSLEAYYQEAGRAGRDGNLAFPVMLFRRQDFEKIRGQLIDSHPDLSAIQKAYNALYDSLGLALGSEQTEAHLFDIDDLAKRSGLPGNIVRNCLSAMEHFDLITRTNDYQPEVGIRFKAGRRALIDRIDSMENRDKAAFLDDVMRFFGPESMTEMRFHEQRKVAAHLRKSPNAITKGLEIFKKEGVLDYELHGGKPLIMARLPRERRVPLAKAEVLRYRDILLKKLDYMLAYATTTQCRSKFLSLYFGETSAQDCGICDNCMRRKQSGAGEINRKQVQQIGRLVRSKPMEVMTLAAELGIDERQVSRITAWMVREGLIKKTGHLFEIK